jgi:hypothetical protein
MGRQKVAKIREHGGLVESIGCERGEAKPDPERTLGSDARLHRGNVALEIRGDLGPALASVDIRTIGQMDTTADVKLH